jgi:hypothetical protein
MALRFLLRFRLGRIILSSSPEPSNTRVSSWHSSVWTLEAQLFRTPVHKSTPAHGQIYLTATAIPFRFIG